MLVRLQKLDDGIGLRLPSELCEQLGLTLGATFCTLRGTLRIASLRSQ
jgi:hypothetical protein